MEIAALFASSFLVALSGVMMPGPVTTVTIAHAVSRGPTAGPLVALGHGLVEGVLVIGLVLGLSHLLQLPLVGSAIGVAGGLCLLYMGTGMIRTPAPLALASAGSGAPGGMGPMASGALASVANPYWVLWWATVGATYLMLTIQHGPPGVVAFYAGHFLADLGWLTVLGSAVAAGRKLLTPTLYRGILAVCGVFLLVLGVYFLATGADSLLHL